MAAGIPGTPIGERDKDPDARLDYGFDWSKWLKADTISASSWFVPVGIDEATPAPSFTATDTTIWIDGGTVGQSYDLINSIQTAAGRLEDRTLRLTVKER